MTTGCDTARAGDSCATSSRSAAAGSTRRSRESWRRRWTPRELTNVFATGILIACIGLAAMFFFSDDRSLGDDGARMRAHSEPASPSSSSCSRKGTGDERLCFVQDSGRVMEAERPRLPPMAMVSDGLPRSTGAVYDTF